MSIPDKEYQNRMAKVQSILEEKEIDLAIVYFDEYNNMNGRYLTGWTPFFDKSAVIIPRGKEPVLVGGSESEDFARDAYIKNYRNVDAFKIPEEEYPSSKIITFKELFSEFIEVSKNKESRYCWRIHDYSHDLFRDDEEPGQQD